MAYVVMAHIVIAHIVMAYVVMAHTVMAYIVMAYIVMTCSRAAALISDRGIVGRCAWMSYFRNACLYTRV